MRWARMNYRKATIIVFAVAIIIVTALFSRAIVGAQELQQQWILKVSDANSLIIGLVQGFAADSLSLAIVALKVDGVPLPLLVSHSQFLVTLVRILSLGTAQGRYW